jgi:eukaryotic-like serine/threonine-protein kinase
MGAPLGAAPSSAPKPPQSTQPSQLGAPSSATLLKRYSTAEVQEVLARAIDQQELKRADARLDFDDLIAAAAEVGVEPQILREASRELRLRQADKANEGAAVETYVRRQRRRFFRHLGIWAIVNTALTLFGLLQHDLQPMLVTAIFWGIAVAIQGMRAFTVGEDDWREEREKAERKQRKEQKRAQVINRAIDEGVSVLVQTGAVLRKRAATISTPAPATPAPARVRVAAAPADLGARDEAAEAEAAAAEKAPGEAKRQRR